MPSLSVPFSLHILVSTNQKLRKPVRVGFYWGITEEAGLIELHLVIELYL